MLARPVHAALPLLLAACLLIHVAGADCSRPSPPEKPRKHAAIPHHAALPHKHYDAGTGTDDRAASAVATAEDEGKRIRADDGGAAISTSVRGKDHDGFVSGGNWSAALPRSKLARRFLLVEGADSAAGPSCHSNDVHNRPCPPASKG